MSSYTEPSKRNFVLLFWHFITQRDYQRFGCDTFSRRGYDIKLVSCWDALNTRKSKDFVAGDFRNIPLTISPASREEVEDFLDTLSPSDFIIVTVPLLADTHWLFQALDRRNLRYSYPALGNYPANFAYNLNSAADALKCLRTAAFDFVRFSRRFLQRLRLILKIGLPYFKLNSPLFYIRAGSYKLAFSAYVPHLRHSQVIDVECFDKGWARLAEENDVDLPTQPYAVFLDEAMSHHPDWKIEGGQPKNIAAINADLNRTLNKIESDIGVTIIIALHPKSSYSPSEINETFGGRVTYMNRTAALVRGAQLVIGHASSSFALAVIYEKPTIFLTNPQIRESRDGLYADYLASWLGQTPLDMSELSTHSDSRITLPSVSKRDYDIFARNFICTDSSEKGPIWEIVADRFEDATNAPNNLRQSREISRIGKVIHKN